MSHEAAQRRLEPTGVNDMTEGSAEPVLTVVLVGRSRLAARWAGERNVRLVRARDGLDALGELRSLASAGAVALVLEHDSIPPQDEEEFVAAARRVAPGAVILRAGRRGGNADAGIDGVIAETGGVDDVLREVLRARSGTMTRGPAAEGRAEGQMTVEPFGPERAGLRMLLSGGDVLGPAISRLREAFAPAQVRFVLAADSDARAAASEGESAVPVQHRDKVFGWLVGPAPNSADLDDAARWLALWIALQEQHAQLKTAALTDSLTGAWNRRYLDRFLAGAIARAHRQRRDVTLLLFDIDDFKTFNDRFGHVAGDEILREVVSLLRSVIRPSDRVCRVGGDEFAVVFDDPDGPRDAHSRHPSSIYDIALRFQKQIREHRFPKLGDEARGELTISGGLAAFPWDAHEATGLIEHADRLLLESKRLGKGVISIGPRRGDQGPRPPGGGV